MKESKNEISSRLHYPQKELNFGKLFGKIPFAKNIVYYRRGLEEVSLNLTNACPNACSFCIRDKDAGWKVSNLYFEQDPYVKDILEAFSLASKKIASSGKVVKKVKICGYGEPLMRFNDLFPIISYIKSKNPEAEIQLTTTGWPYFKYISQEISKLKELKEAGLTEIYLSLNTLNKEVYKNLVKPGIDNYIPSAFEDSIKFGIAARDLGLGVTLGFINLANINENEVKVFANKLNVKYKLRNLEQ